jgi:hypothetical protein
MKMIKGLAFSLACWGCVLPAAAFADGPKAAPKSAQKAAPVVTDIALGAGGTFSGQVVDAQGRGLDGAVIAVSQSGKEIAKTTADKDGNFAVKSLKGGTYDVVAGRSQGVYRFWAPNTAPPSAKSQALLVSQASAVRGQGLGGVPPITYAALGTGIAGTTLGAVNMNKIDNIKNQVDKIPTSP